MKKPVKYENGTRIWYERNNGPIYEQWYGEREWRYPRIDGPYVEDDPANRTKYE